MTSSADSEHYHSGEVQDVLTGVLGFSVYLEKGQHIHYVKTEGDRLIASTYCWEQRNRGIPIGLLRAIANEAACSFSDFVSYLERQREANRP